MRSLQECQAEVFRRSQRKIKQRRQRIIGILLCCIPLAVCLMLLPRGNSKEERLLAELSASPSPTVVQIEISGTNGSFTLRQHDISQLLGLMEGYSVQQSIADGGIGAIEPEAAPEAAPPPTENLDINEDAGYGVSDRDDFTDRNMTHGTDIGYTITLVMSDGTEIAYYLLENTLTDQQTGQVTVLSEQQAEALRRFIEEP